MVHPAPCHVLHQWQPEGLFRESLQAWGLFEVCSAQTCVHKPFVFVCVRGHISAFTTSLWTLFPASLSKPFVNLLMLSATYVTSYGNNFQKFITSCVKNQEYSYLSSASKIFQFQVFSNSWGILNLPSSKEGS